MSEEGGRLRNKRNLGIVIDHQSSKDIEFGNDYKWATLKQIKELILENAMVNPHLRLWYHSFNVLSFFMVIE